MSLIIVENNLVGLKWVNGGSLFEDLQSHRVMDLGTGSPIPSLDNLNGLVFHLRGDISFLPLTYISDTEGEASIMVEPIITTMPAPLK